MVVIGAGAAGLIAAGRAAAAGARVTVLERNRAAGRKLLISGKGRCNVTNAATVPALVAGMAGNGKFLYGAFSRHGPAELRDHLRSLGVATKVERGGRVFPASDDAASVRDAWLRDAMERGCNLAYGRRAGELVLADDQPAASGRAGSHVSGVRTAAGELYPAAAVVVATGGSSYPGTGSTGDGYQLARGAGHRIVPPQPSLVPLCCREGWPARLSGLSLRNVRLTAASSAGSALGAEFGEMLFTHFGVSGPIVLKLSRAISLHLGRGGDQVRLSLDLKPALTPEVLARRVQRDLDEYSNREFRNTLGGLVPGSLGEVLVELSGIPPAKRAREISRAERGRLTSLLKGLPLTVEGTRGFREAIVTAGGVDVREVSPQTMGSRLVAGLYFAGEVLDVDGYTGGYNLQAAFSTGWLAGEAAGAGNAP